MPGLLALWLVDGNHKLIRWGFVIHGAIDNFSCKIMYLKFSTMNMACTVLDLIINTTKQFRLQSRVRADQGDENVDIVRHIFSHHLHRPSRRSFIARNSCHNQRFERLWRDVFSVILSIFYRVFWYLEENGSLDISDKVHLYALRLIYILLINNRLIEFTRGWNNHPFLTERNRSPNQLWGLE